MFEALRTIAVGLVVGMIAKFLLPGNDSNNPFTTTIAGVVGSLGATYIGKAMGWLKENEKAGWLASIAGAMIAVAAYRFIRG